MSGSVIATIDDPAARALALRLRARAAEVREPQRSRILDTLPTTIFISHTSLDDVFIKGIAAGDSFPRRGSIWWICRDYFPDPFYHSLRTGGADSYERIVGLALLASKRVLIIWSKNAWRSDYVQAELLVATESNKKLGVYIQPGTPDFPLNNVPMIYNRKSFRSFLSAW
jgi:hypothetical protein